MLLTVLEKVSIESQNFILGGVDESVIQAENLISCVLVGLNLKILKASKTLTASQHLSESRYRGARVLNHQHNHYYAEFQ